ncbi:SprT-like domain-containing protein [Emticicia sp. TH156]|uniref:SprT-like domain-containing protein n=1 Tax=Emticicia sp. TH156 TaxID=2067454 RepID=UPI000C790FD8|nr:SprT-like domain-containing protein [Emticicia sp. TH156]PLK46281.1 transcription elongation protein SprT [Emticicia sp. TH156]
MSITRLFKSVTKALQEKPIPPLPVSYTPEVAQKMLEMLSRHVPAQAVDYCLALWKEQPFSFKITRTRSSCFGNYTFKDGLHKITVNNDLNAYAFVITYIHEIAHQRAWLNKTRKKIEPHGAEWKKSFQQLMAPILNLSVFPETVFVPLSKYMSNPAASSVSYAPLAKALQMHELTPPSGVLLSDVADNRWFTFRNTVFQRLEKRRTRVLCMERNSRRRYTILATARVDLIEEQ